MKIIQLIFLCSFCCWTLLSAQQNGVIDAPGDILIIGYNDAALNPGDGFSFLAVDDIPDGTQIIFTEDEWDGTQFEGNEGEVVWTNNTGNTLPRGTVITIENADDTGGTIAPSLGTAMEVGSFSLALPEVIYVITVLAWLQRLSPFFRLVQQPAMATPLRALA